MLEGKAGSNRMETVRGGKRVGIRAIRVGKTV